MVWALAVFSFLLTCAAQGRAQAPATMTSPSPGSVLGGSSATFSWTAGTGVTAYWLDLGTLGAGSTNIYSSGSLPGTSVTVSNLPTNGVSLYATLFSKINGAWVPEGYTYTESGSYVLAAMTSPTPGSTLSGTSTTFNWSAGSGVTAYWLYVGSTGVNSNNLLNSGSITGTSLTVNGLPANGVLLYVTLYSKIDGGWKPISYTYTESGSYVLAAIFGDVQLERGVGSDSLLALCGEHGGELEQPAEFGFHQRHFADCERTAGQRRVALRDALL
jgi:hypothetical protein